MSNFSLALFDLDDTLVDHTRSVERALRSTLCRRHGSLSTLEPAELRRLWGLSFWKHWPGVIRGHISLLESRALRVGELLDSLDITADKNELTEIAEEYGKLYMENVELINGVEPVLELLVSRNIEIGIVTNTTTRMVREKMEKTGLGRFIRTAVSAQDAGKMKPDAEIFRISLQKTGFPREEAVFVGDSIKNDVEGARNAGIAPVWFNRYGMDWTEDRYTVPVLENYDSPEVVYSKMRNAALSYQ